jgi:hypothetical protein
MALLHPLHLLLLLLQLQVVPPLLPLALLVGHVLPPRERDSLPTLLPRLLLALLLLLLVQLLLLPLQAGYVCTRPTTTLHHQGGSPM